MTSSLRFPPPQSPPARTKVVAYITRGSEILVFSHPNAPDAGIQVPAGTVEPGESLDRAVLREAEEETGLEGLRLMAYLGMRELDGAEVGLTGRTHFHFFHVVHKGAAPLRWRHFERHPSDGTSAPIEFELYWVPLPDAGPQLVDPQASFLHLLLP